MKICSKCHVEKEATKEHFYIRSDSISGFRKQCIECYKRINRKSPIKKPMESVSIESKRKTNGYNSWNSMKARCYNKNTFGYERYGGRGIKVSDDWKKSYHNFIRDVGERPSIYHSIDRIDNDGNYEKGNCKWSTRFEQAQNRRKRKSSSCSNDSGKSGVSWNKNRNKWQATIGVNGKHVWIGNYQNVEDAIRDRKEAEIKHFGNAIE